MKRTIWILPAIVVLAGLGYWIWSGRAGDTVSLDLVEAFPGAEKRSNLAATAAFNMDPQTIQGVTRPAIFMHPTSRVTYKGIAIPEGGRFRAWLGVKEDAWDKGTDGVLFRVAVSSEGVYTEIVTRAVDPFHNTSDRGWVAVDEDLSKWAGKSVDLIVNTNASKPGIAPNDSYDFAVIGSPAVVAVVKPS